jgi:hypothetical protein
VGSEEGLATTNIFCREGGKTESNNFGSSVWSFKFEIAIRKTEDV